MKYRLWVVLFFWLIILGAGPAAAAEQTMDEMVVESERLVEKQDTVTIKPEGLPAEVDVITKEDLKRMPYTGDAVQMLRQVPGLDVQVFPRGDMGVQLGMRGFIGNNVTAVFVDGMPLNTLNWAHGLLNIGWLVPEMIERIEVIKGPFSPLYGNFARAGVINFVTKKSDSSPSVGLYGGTYGTGRAVGVISDQSWSQSLKNVTPFLVWEGYSRNGYRVNEDFQRGQFFNKFTFPVPGGNLSVRGHYCTRTWGDSGYTRVDLIKSGAISRTAAVNLSDRGDSEMADVVVNYEPKGGEAGFHGTLYFCYMWNATGRSFPLRTQARRDSAENYYGWKLLYDYRPLDNLSFVVGNDLRQDVCRQNQWNTENYYTLLKRTTALSYSQFNTGFFVQAQYKPFSFFKLIGGGRYDIFNTDVTNELYPENSGKGSTDVFSPKVGIVITPYKDINIFANHGTGFDSPSPKQMSPTSATRKANFDLGVSELRTWDVGFNALLFKRLYVAFDYYNTLNKKEQSFDVDTQTYINLGASKRTGWDVEAKIFVTKELTIYGSYSDVRARLKNPANPGEIYITQLPEDQSVVGLEFQKAWANGTQSAGLNFYYLRIGRKPANVTGSYIGSQFDQYYWKASYRYKNWTLSMDTVLTPRHYAGQYYYLDTAGNLSIVPLPMWEIFGGLKYQF